MTSGIPNYSETEFISHAWVEEPKRNLTAEELVAAAYPTGTNDLPVTDRLSLFQHQLHPRRHDRGQGGGQALCRPGARDGPRAARPALDLLSPGTYPPEVIARLAHGYFENTACADYQPPDCEESWNKPLLGRDVREDSTSWAQAAGGAISNARDVDPLDARRLRGPRRAAGAAGRMAVDGLDEDRRADRRRSRRRTRRASPSASPRALMPDGPVWFYQGMTLGYRTLYVWFEDDDILITVQTNSQPNDDVNKLHDAATAIHAALKDTVAFSAGGTSARPAGGDAQPRSRSSMRIGKRRGRTPVACQTALAIAPTVPVMPISPTPLTPSALT